MEKTLATAEDLAQEAADFAVSLKPHAATATLVTLTGDLGAGKTTFVQEVAKALGVRETITSPTFVIEKIYPLAHKEFGRLIHIDAYRLKGTRELDVLDWSEILRDPSNLIFIEWPERIEEAVPQTATVLNFRFIDEQTRAIDK